MRNMFGVPVAGLTLASLLVAGLTPAGVFPAVAIAADPVTNPTVREPGVTGVPQPPDVPDVEVRGFGGFEEAPEALQQPGNAAMRYLRRGADALREALDRLERAAVAGDAMATATARRDCRLLIETLRENNPADIMADDLDLLDGVLADPKQGDPGVAVARLQRAAMNFRFLYPATDLEREVATINQMIRDRRPDEALAEARALRTAVAAVATAAPTAALEQAFAGAQRLLDARQTDTAVRRIRTAREAVGAVHTAGLLGEAVWYLDRSVDALDQGLLEIARVSAGNAESFLAAAGQEAPALAKPLAALRADTARLGKAIAAGDPPVPPGDVLALARRVQALTMPD